MSVTTVISCPDKRVGWLGSADFDFLLLAGLTGLSLLAGLVIAANPNAVGVILLADNWLLGFPHVAATFTRLVPDRAAIKQHRFLVFGLPPLVVAVTAALAFGLGVWAVATIYFYWQWFHTARQSWGIAKLYSRESGGLVRDNPNLLEGLFYIVPFWGLLHRLTTARDHFLFPSLQLAVPIIPAALANGVGIIACAGLIWWSINRVRDALAGRLAVQHTLFSLSHFLIFIVGYIVMDDMTGGWIVTNIWHTGQYLMLVWLFNQRSLDRGGSGPGALFRFLTRGNRPWLYVFWCFVIAVPVYLSFSMLWMSGVYALTFVVIANQTLNFHHFIVDGVIWRSRRAAASPS
jgi:hypothetical protein